MTVRVVQRRPDPPEVLRIVCERCDTLLEYVQSDVQSFDGSVNGGVIAGSEWVVCPKCTKNATIRSW